MGFKAGLYVGAAIGYVLGARAGRERYEEIMSAIGSLTRSDPAQQIGSDLKVMANRAGEKLEEAASDGANKVSSMVRGGSDTPNGGRATF